MSRDVKVPFYDHAAEYRSIKPDINRVVTRVLESGSYQKGKEVRAFEEESAEYSGVKHAIATGSCYDAIFRALLAFGVGHGDEVITVANTDIAGTAAISHTGASIVWIDIDGQTYNMDPTRIEERVTPRTKAIIAVHMYGHPADMDPITDVARRHDLFVVEDAALALGACYKGRRVGTIGDVGCFSYAPSKILAGYGDGGMAVTDNSEIAEKIRKLFIYEEVESRYIFVDGQRIHSGYQFSTEGYRERMLELPAAFLRVKLKRIDEWIARRREIAATYGKLLGNLDVVLPIESEAVEHVYRNYTIRVKNRDEVRYRLAKKGVATGMHYVPPLHLQPVYQHLGYHEGALPVTESVSAELFTLPIYPQLSQEQIEWVSLALKESISEVNGPQLLHH